MAREDAVEKQQQKYVIANTITAGEIKRLRKMLGLT